MRLIDADSLKDELNAWARVIMKPKLMGSDEVMCVIDHAPTIDTVPKWIPCSERLPAFGEDVLLSLGGRLHNVGYLVPTNEWKYGGWYHPFDDVFAWMPLPEPYKIDGKEQDDGRV